MKPRLLVIALDGPSGVGKSTVARALAQRLGLRYLDTGAMYRVLALEASKRGLVGEGGLASEVELGALARELDIRFEGGADEPRVTCNGKDVTEAIRHPRIGELASALSVFPEVRRAMVAMQQAMISSGGWTLDGRDTTTVVAPNAHLKVYLDATPEVRARRRFEELRAKGIETSLQDVLEAQRERDLRDSTREDSPLRRAEDAVYIDASSLSVEQVVETILGRLEL